MSTVVRNPSPKSRFQEIPKRIELHRDMVASPAFEIAADFAMLNYVASLATNLPMTTPTFNDYAVIGVKVCAALEYLQQMRMLAESRPASAPTITDNLDHSK